MTRLRARELTVGLLGHEAARIPVGDAHRYGLDSVYLADDETSDE